MSQCVALKKNVWRSLLLPFHRHVSNLLPLLQVPILLLLENGPMREAADLVQQPWFKLFHFLAAWRPDIDMAAWANSTKQLAAHPQAFERQLDAVATLCPPHMSAGAWDMLVEEQLRTRLRSGYTWEELLSSWVAMYCLVTQPSMSFATTSATIQGGMVAALYTPAIGGGGGSVGGLESPQGSASTEASSQDLPGLDEFLLQMYAMEADPAAQLDALAMFKPSTMSTADWDRAVGKVGLAPCLSKQ